MTNTFPTTQSTTTEISEFAAKAKQTFVSEYSANATGGFLKFSGKTGRWEMGKDDEDFDGVEVLINSLQIQHGFVRWGTKPPAKAHTKITQELPEAPDPFDGVDEKGRPKTYHAQPSRVLTGATFDDQQDQFTFETGSMGGVENTDKLIAEIMVKAADSQCIFPVVKLGTEYWTRDTGKVYKPVFEIQSWHDIDGNEEGAAPAKLEAAPEEAEVVEVPKKKKRTRKAAGA
jgi:hypothetical protein